MNSISIIVSYSSNKTIYFYKTKLIQLCWPVSLIPSSLTITSLRSLVCKWWSGSKKFCLILSSNEYFTSAICLSASPNSTRPVAETNICPLAVQIDFCSNYNSTPNTYRIHYLLLTSCHTITCNLLVFLLAVDKYCF